MRQPFPHHFFTFSSLKCYISPNSWWILLNLVCNLDVWYIILPNMIQFSIHVFGLLGWFLWIKQLYQIVRACLDGFHFIFWKVFFSFVDKRSLSEFEIEPNLNIHWHEPLLPTWTCSGCGKIDLSHHSVLHLTLHGIRIHQEHQCTLGGSFVEALLWYLVDQRATQEGSGGFKTPVFQGAIKDIKIIKWKWGNLSTCIHVHLITDWLVFDWPPVEGNSYDN